MSKEIRAVLDVDGNVKSIFNYEPYGVEIPPYNESAQNSHKFTGHERDETTGFDYMHFRYYGSNIGRFMKPDNVTGSPLNPQNWNLYSYVRGNPVNMNDPMGHACPADLSVAPPPQTTGSSIESNPMVNPVEEDSANDPPNSATAVLLTDMTNGQTTLMINNPGNGVNWVQYSIPTFNGVDTDKSKPGAQNGFITSDVEGQDRGRSVSYGIEGAYIETNDIRGRDIHGGGITLADPYADTQQLTVTIGCTRGHNVDVKALGNMINDFKEDAGGRVPYIRYGTPSGASRQDFTIPNNSPMIRSIMAGILVISP